MSSSQDLTQSRNTSKTALLSNSMDMEEEQEKGDDELPAGISWKTVVSTSIKLSQKLLMDPRISTFYVLSLHSR